VKERLRYRRVRSLLYLLSLLAGCVAVGSMVKIQVLQAGDYGPVFYVAEGEVFSLRYTHSMYGVPVTERFRVENGCFTLFHVISSDAALDYFGIERKEENNAERTAAEFLIPQASVGRHVLLIKDRKIKLRDLAGQDERVRVRMAQIPIITYIAKHVWR
jgi:hypothetical protein